MPSTRFLSNTRKTLVMTAAAATGVGSYLYWKHLLGPRPLNFGENAGDRFTVPRFTSLGWYRPAFEHLGRDAAEALLKRNEMTRTFEPSRTRAIVTRFDNNWDVLSTENVADLAKDSNFSQSLTGDSSLKLFSVIDGHGGTAMADALTQKLHPAIVSSLQCSLDGGIPKYTDPLSAMRNCREGALAFMSSYSHFECSGRGTFARGTTRGQQSLAVISDALSAAFTNLDYEICVKPLRDILANGARGGEKADYSDTLAPAATGACAVTVLVDEESQNVYVAHAGDSRAVAGYWIPPQTLQNGSRFDGGWRCEVLTADHNAMNPSEVDRLAREHPGEENVIDSQTGRVLGSLMMARAFGDATFFKWSDQERKDVLERIENPSPRLLKTPSSFDAVVHTSPPYVTAKPDVAVRSLEKNKDAKGQLKFIVSATDGLWDLLSSEEAVGLVASHLAHPQHDPVPRRFVQSELLKQSPGSSARFPGPRSKDSAVDGDWVFQDDNAATHLIRNAFGTSSEVHTVHQMLSLTGPPARDFKDDVTCSVIFFDGPAKGDFKSQTSHTEERQGLLTSLMERWNRSPIGMGPSAFVWKYPSGQA